MAETSMSIRAVMSRPLATVAILAGIAIGLVISVAPVEAQRDIEFEKILQAYDAVEESKSLFSETMIGFVADLGGAYGIEGYRLRTALETMDASLAAWDDAIGTLERLASSVSTPAGRLVLAQVYLDRHRVEDARRESQRAIDLEPARPHGYAMLGRIHLAESQAELAVAAFETATAADPGDVLNFYHLASAYDSVGRATDADGALQALVEAAERRLDVLWSEDALPISDRVRSRVLAERSLFVTRRAPICLSAMAFGAGFGSPASSTASTNSCGETQSARRFKPRA